MLTVRGQQLPFSTHERIFSWKYQLAMLSLIYTHTHTHTHTYIYIYIYNSTFCMKYKWHLATTWLYKQLSMFCCMSRPCLWLLGPQFPPTNFSEYLAVFNGKSHMSVCSPIRFISRKLLCDNADSMIVFWRHCVRNRKIDKLYRNFFSPVQIARNFIWQCLFFAWNDIKHD